MPTYRNGCICLDRNEAKEFCKQIIQPDKEAARLRDKFLAEIYKTLEIKLSEDRVVLIRK